MRWPPSMITLAITFIVLSCVLPGSVRAQDTPPRIRIEPVGTSFTTGDESGTYLPIYSLVIGSPEEGERLALNWSSRFGMHALLRTGTTERRAKVLVDSLAPPLRALPSTFRE